MQVSVITVIGFVWLIALTVWVAWLARSNAQVAITTLECNDGVGDDYYVCAKDADSAKTKAKAYALKDYQCAKGCYPEVSFGEAKRTDVFCQSGDPEWSVHVDVFCKRA